MSLAAFGFSFGVTVWGTYSFAQAGPCFAALDVVEQLWYFIIFDFDSQDQFNQSTRR